MNRVPRALSPNQVSNWAWVISPQRGGFAAAGAGPQYVEAALLPLDGVVQAVQVVQVGGVALDAGDVAANLLHGLVQRVLTAAGDEDVRSLVDEQLRAGQRQAGGAAGDDRYLAVELSHGRFLRPVVPCAPGVPVLSTPIGVLTVPGGPPGRKLSTPVVTWLGYRRPMTEPEKGPRGRRRGRGARERILSASQQLFREQGINRTGMDQLCAAAQVSKRTAYQYFTGKDEIIAEYLRRFDPSVLPGVFDRTDLTPRMRLLAAFDMPPTTPLCPYIAAAVELHDPLHPASQYARDYKKAVAARLADTAREAGAADPEQLGEQLALLIDGAAARTRVLNADAFPAAAAIAAVLIDNAIPATAGEDRRREEVPVHG